VRGEQMKKKSVSTKKNGRKSSKSVAKPEMLPHYDFTGAVKGKHYKKFREGINIRVLESGESLKLITLDDDVKSVFPDSKSVNDALRHIIAAIPKRTKKKAA
jgi:hypothetical protein